MSSTSDADLVARLRRRQPGGFDELYRLHAPRIWRFLRQLAGRTDTAEDLFQDTWLAAARNAHRLREDTRLLPWLFTIARNKHRNALRMRAFDERRKVAASAEPVSGAPGPDTETDTRALARRVTRAFGDLAETHREILVLSVVEGLESEDIARVLALRPEAVRKRLSRARAELLRLAAPDDMGKGHRP